MSSNESGNSGRSPGEVFNRMFSRLGIAFLWVLSCLPYRWCARFGEGLGSLLFRIPGSRRNVVLTNLRLCFPHLDGAQIEALAHEHFRWLIRSFAERGVLWFGSRERVRSLVRLESAVDLRERVPRIFLSMHMVGIEGGAIGLSAHLAGMAVEGNATTLYTKMSNPLMDAFIKHRRERFGGEMIERTGSGRELIRLIRRGAVVLISPDMDFGRRDSEFVPFFGVPACTLTSVARLARQTGAQIVPMVTTMLPGYQGYVLRILPPWDDFPGESVTADTHRMNAHFESQIEPVPAQYYWVHKRFKNRPDGEASVY